MREIVAETASVATRYLDREHALFPNTVVVALGVKAHDRTKGLEHMVIVERHCRRG
jgi:hypothetical protein